MYWCLSLGHQDPAAGHQQGFQKQMKLVLKSLSKECHEVVKGVVKSFDAFHDMPVYMFILKAEGHRDIVA